MTGPRQAGPAPRSALHEHHGKASSAQQLAGGFVALSLPTWPCSGVPRPLCFSAVRVHSPSFCS